MNCLITGDGLSTDCFETVLQTMAEGLFIVDAQGIIRFCNHGLERLSGFSADKIIGKKCNDIMVCACGSTRECGLFTAGAINNIECQLRRSDGSPLPVLKNGRVLYGPDGATLGGVETVTDISALKIEQRRNAVLSEQVSRETGKFHLLVGKSKPMQDVFELIELAAGATATVLVTGETGTGKELVARTIHDRSSRKNGPMVKVNCSALTESLLESELFGHARGSFTGALKDKIGRFEMADGGTLFLDEIGEISPYIQVKLLRFLQEHEFERVGEGTTRKADVRIIAATNRDLRSLVAQGEFREDLYYRLKVFPIRLPALRQRKEDVGLLISHFIDKFNKHTGKSISGLTSDAALTLMDYCWPGNIRELENAIEHAFVTCREKEIGTFDLPLEIRHVELRSAECRPSEGVAAAGLNRRLTKSVVEEALRESGGNRGRAAQALGIDRTTLWRYLKR